MPRAPAAARAPPSALNPASSMQRIPRPRPRQVDRDVVEHAPFDSTTTRLARNTASLTSCVMNSTVERRCAARCASALPAASCGSARRRWRRARPSAARRARWRARAPRRRAAACRRRVRWDSARPRAASPASARYSRAISCALGLGARRASWARTPTLSSTVRHGNSANDWNTTPRSGPGPLTGAAVDADLAAGERDETRRSC